MIITVKANITYACAHGEIVRDWNFFAMQLGGSFGNI
jgi:hypothetical protein